MFRISDNQQKRIYQDEDTPEENSRGVKQAEMFKWGVILEVACSLVNICVLGKLAF